MKIDELVKEYRLLKESLDHKRREFKKFEDECKERMLELEISLLDKSNQLGVDSFKTQYGTAFRVTKTYARLATGPDSVDARIKYSMESGDFGLFTSHVNKTHAKELLDDGMNLEEIGISWIEEAGIQFRKPTE